MRRLAFLINYLELWDASGQRGSLAGTRLVFQREIGLLFIRFANELRYVLLSNTRKMTAEFSLLVERARPSHVELEFVL